MADRCANDAMYSPLTKTITKPPTTIIALILDDFNDVTREFIEVRRPARWQRQKPRKRKRALAWTTKFE